MYDQYQGFIFDMDGTLIDMEPAHHKAWCQVLSSHGMQFNKSVIAPLNGAPTWYIAKILIESNKVRINPHQLAQEKTMILHSNLFNDVIILPLIDVVKRYYGKIPMAIGTGSEHQTAETILRHFGLLHYFDAIVGADDVTHYKPDPHTFLRCAELMDIPPESCIVFEDADLGIMAAKAANMAFVDVRKLNE